MTVNLARLPEDLPVPQDDGASDHLKGMSLPRLPLMATNGELVDLSEVKGLMLFIVIQ